MPDLNNRIGFYKSRKFKNNAISVIIPVGMGENVTGYNVLSQVLKRGTERFATSSEISRYLQDMYGSFFDIIIGKRGDKLFLTFYISFLDNRFTLYGEDLWEKAVELVKEVIYRPRLVDGRFQSDIVSQEIEDQKLYIQSQYDDKGHYNSIKVMEQGLLDSYSKPEFGTMEELAALDGEVLLELWKDLRSREAYIQAAGNIEDESRVSELLSGIFDEANGGLRAGRGLHDHVEPVFVKDLPKVEESMKINQGKMSLLYSTNTDIFRGDYFSLAVMNSIFGGGAHSKLFNEVREKHSLCYYVYSTFDKFKGVMTISSGVDFKNFDKARELIELELEKMKSGDFTDEEIAMSKTRLKATLVSMEDSMYNTMEYISSLRVYGIGYTVEDVIKSIEEVDRDRIMAVAGKLEFITSHYLVKEEESDVPDDRA